jgi:hypothetical protein
MIPTIENITEVAQARVRAIRAQAERVATEFGVWAETAIVSDEKLVAAVVRLAERFAGKAGTAQAAVQWAISDLTPYDVLEPS